MKKKTVGLLLAVGVGLSLITGCAGKKTDKKTNAVSSTQTSGQQKKIKGRSALLTGKTEISTLIARAVKDGNSLDFPQIDFASDQGVMFHNENGFYYYDLKKKSITMAVDLKSKLLFSMKKGDVCTVQADENGAKAIISLKGDANKKKAWLLDVKSQQLYPTDQAGFDQPFKRDLQKDYKQSSFASLPVTKISAQLEKLGKNDSNAVIAGKNTIVFLGYLNHVFVTADDMFRNLTVEVYDVSSKKLETFPVFKGYTAISTKKKASQLLFDQGKVWMKRDQTGALYFDVDALTGTKGAQGTFGNLVIGNVFKTGTGTLVFHFDDARKLNVTLKPVLMLGQTNEEGEPQELELKKDQSTYTFSNLSKNVLYYIDCYPTKDSEDDRQMKKIDDENAKVAVTIGNK